MKWRVNRAADGKSYEIRDSQWVQKYVLPDSMTAHAVLNVLDEIENLKQEIRKLKEDMRRLIINVIPDEVEKLNEI